jgi:regulator of sigma E protease
MEPISMIIDYLVPFLIVLTVLVFVHELGHYLVARRCGVRIEVFSIGFGPELFGFTDKAETRWKFSAVPLGGYVKMFGDADAASTPDTERQSQMSASERAVAFPQKTVGQRAAIVAAGPFANFLFAIVVLWGLFATIGHPFPPPEVGDVVEGSPAQEAGFAPGDTILQAEGRSIMRFAEIAAVVHRSEGEPVTFTVLRDGERLTLTATPEPFTVETADGEEVTIHRVGIMATGGEPYGVMRSAGLAFVETGNLVWMTVTAVGEMIVGDRGTEDLGGPIRIAQISGDVAQVGVVALIWFMALLSINLGLINLFPIPMLDGGHLLFYAFEAVRGRPLGQRAQEYGFRIGLALVLTLMVFATWNDLVQLQVVDMIRDFVS